MATAKKATKTAKSDQLLLKRQTVKDLTPDSARERKVQGGMLPPTKGCPKLGPY